MSYKIGFIGSGNMARAIANGLVNKFPTMNKNIFVTDRLQEKGKDLSEGLGVQWVSDNKDLVSLCDIIVLAVKPNIYEKVLENIKSFVTKDHIIISIAAGISIDYIQSYFDIPLKIIRTMPNTPVLVGEGMIALTPNTQVDQNELDFVIDMFESIGKVDIIDEKLMDMIPAISGSSPAYVYMFIEALADGAVLQGMARDKAYRYAAQAVLGSAKMVLETEKHPGELKDMVCSPGGTTIEAVYSLEKNNFRGSVIEAMNACTDKAKALANK